MRTQWIASLVSLSLSAGYAAHAQEALSSRPPTTTASTTTASTSPAAGTLAPHSGAAAAAEAPNSGARDFHIPWSRPAAGVLPFEQATVGASQLPDKPRSVSRGAQVSPLAAEVKPNYVQPPRAAYTAGRSPAAAADGPATSVLPEASSPTASADSPLAQSATAAPRRSRSLLDAVPWGSAPRSTPVVSTEEPLAPKPAADEPAADEPAADEARIGQVAATPNLASKSTKSRRVPATTVAMSVSLPSPQLPQSQPAPSPLQLSELLIQPIPADKLPPATSTDVSPAERPVATAVPPEDVAAPHYVLVDTQPSASDLCPPEEQITQQVAVTPVVAISNRFTDQLEPAPSVAAPSRLPPPLTLAVPSPAPLLTTESMIGPLQGAENLFQRLEIEHDLRDVASRIESGPRGDAGNYAWMPAAYTWISPAFYHHPLYFEQPNLERYGQGTKRVLQPLASSIHFFGSIPLVPYKTLTHHPREKVYTLGSMRPGNCVPLQRGVILGPSRVGEVTMFWEECSGY